MQWWSRVVRLQSRHPSGSTRRCWIRPNYQHLHPRVCICAQPAICICLCAIYVGKFPGRFSYLSCRLKVAIMCRALVWSLGPLKYSLGPLVYSLGPLVYSIYKTLGLVPRTGCVLFSLSMVYSLPSMVKFLSSMA